MRHSVFILGAGASKTAGAPMMKKLLDKANELFQRGKVAG